MFIFLLNRDGSQMRLWHPAHFESVPVIQLYTCRMTEIRNPRHLPSERLGHYLPHKHGPALFTCQMGEVCGLISSAF